jgi:hypothetical protein
MKIEFTRAEVERIILAYVNGLIPDQHFNTVEGSSYRGLPDTLTVSVEETENAAQ